MYPRQRSRWVRRSDGSDASRRATITGGRRTFPGLSVAFTDSDAARIGGAPLGVPLHPVQLYESAVCLVLFGLLVWLGRRRHRDGDIIAAYHCSTHWHGSVSACSPRRNSSASSCLR